MTRISKSSRLNAKSGTAFLASLVSILLAISSILFFFETAFLPGSWIEVSLPNKPVLAFYYGWYSPESAWYDGVNRSLAVSMVPSAGLYNSGNASMIDLQISEALSAGINGFVASWWGPNSTTDRNSKILFEEASKVPNFSVTLFFETQILSNGTSNLSLEKTTVLKDIDYIEKSYGSYYSFARIDGKQVLFFYDTDVLSPDFWASVTESIHGQYPNLLLIGNSFNTSYVDSFDGLSTYVDLGFMKQNLTGTLQNGTYPTFLQMSSALKDKGKLWFSVATPGFNNSNDRSQPLSIIPRDNGSTFVTSWQIAQNSDPFGIIVGTWNEFFEGTAIEPTTTFGNQYLNITRELSNLWRSGS